MGEAEASMGMTDEELYDEYKGIEDHWDDLHDPDQYIAANDSRNGFRNRYSDVLAMDSSRVRIDAIEGTCEDSPPASDYINANLIDGFHKKYICTQGPTEDTACHFWMMMMDQAVTTIAMLTQTVESNRRKCFQYFAHSEEPELLLLDYDEEPCMNVRLTSEVDVKDPVSGRLLAKHRKLSVWMAIKEEGVSSICDHPTYARFTADAPFEIDHVQHVAWPDHGTPEDPAEIVHLAEYVNELYSASAPLAVHCSAGIGRAGSFISIDSARDALLVDQTPPANVTAANQVNTARACRRFIVQTKDQYRYVARSIEYMKAAL